MVRIKRALVSVSDKRTIVEFCQGLRVLGVEILSTGGTARLLRDAGLEVTEVSHYTGFPEMLDGRIKTLHPKIHGGLLALRDNAQHMETIREHDIDLIDMVVVNLYPFEEVIRKSGVSFEEGIENIDIGGPSMLRSAAKNHQSVAVVCNPRRYESVLTELKNNEGSLSQETMLLLAIEAFGLTSRYDTAIYEYLRERLEGDVPTKGFPRLLSLDFEKLRDVRYGENPQQKAALYRQKPYRRGMSAIRQIQGKELSFNNYLDLNAAFELVNEFPAPAAAIVKHSNPCGVAASDRLEKAFMEAYKCDPLSAFGGIIAVNRKLDKATARRIAASGFLECIIAPGFAQEGLEIFADKRNLRIIESKGIKQIDEWDYKRVSGGLLVQEKDICERGNEKALVVTKKKPTPGQMKSLLFAWKVAKHVKSNAIVLARNTRTVGIGAGQMSRVDAVMIAARKAAGRSKDSCLASDAFFPKADAIGQAHRAGVSAIIQPGGSVADSQIISACDKCGISMVFTGVRHFKH